MLPKEIGHGDEEQPKCAVFSIALETKYQREYGFYLFEETKSFEHLTNCRLVHKKIPGFQPCVN